MQTHLENTKPLELNRYVNLKLAALGVPTSTEGSDSDFLEVTRPLLRNHFEKDELLGWPLCPVDRRIQAFLDRYLTDACPDGTPQLPRRTLVLDRQGLGRLLSLPPKGEEFSSPFLTSYRVEQGVLHNPKSDRRTTKGVFHVAEGGFPVPVDKQAVPKLAFARLLAAAFAPPPDVMTLPFTAAEPESARVFVSLLLRPLVCPATAAAAEKRMEVRFIAPGSLVSNLDFVESIFGNAGDPFLAENDAALDPRSWTGHTGCVILAPHLVGLKKVDLGLPHYDAATARQRRDGMCYRDPSELYNDGNAFKITCRDARGVIVTVIADNYYGYCKKEVKTQISYAANLFGACEEEHAGGVLSFPSYVLGLTFHATAGLELKPTTFARALELLGERARLMPEGYAVDTTYEDVFYVPEGATFSVQEGTVRFLAGQEERTLTLRPERVFVLPSGYRVQLEKHPHGAFFRLVGTRAEGVLCHKPCTVSGGGKSEISKSLKPMLQPAPVFVKDFEHDLAKVLEICKRDFSSCFKQPPTNGRATRTLLSPERSLGSVVKLLTPSSDYTDEHNAWLHALPQTIRELVFVVKRLYRPEWGDDIQSHFSVDSVNGYAGHELRFDQQRLLTNQLRVGFEAGSATWRMFKLRPDFRPSDKVQMEDDITASVIVPRAQVRGLSATFPHQSLKVVANCEEYLFQRPDDAIVRGFDAQAEADLATPGTFITNFEPLDRPQASAMVDKVAELEQFTPPIKQLLNDFVRTPRAGYVVSSAHPRMVDGKPSKNPRYLQRRPDRVNHRDAYLAEVVGRLDGDVPLDQPLLNVVHAVLSGRRANRAQPEISLPPLAAFGPVHYQEPPELFMDFLSSLTGKSPSTTGFGSEGALTKAPFNALWPVVDMNNALVSAILTGYAGFTSVAGQLGPRYRVDHDVSMLVPEVWCRMSEREREPGFLIENGYLEKVNDFEFAGRKVLASRLGYRITPRFVEHFLGRIFQTPNAVFSEDMLRPELQGLEPYASGIDAIVDTQTRVALGYFEDGSVDAACPPLKALLHIMAHGQYQGMTVDDPRFRALFARDVMLQSDWYRERLLTKQRRDIELFRRHGAALDDKLRSASRPSPELVERRAFVARELERVSAAGYVDELVGTLGADPFHGQNEASSAS
jgi:phosphoenolpyruvate carboxykinase (diphosphate)